MWGRWMRKEMSVIYLWEFVREDWFRLAAGRRKWKNNKILSTYIYTKEKRIVESISSEQIIRVFGKRGVWRAGVNNRMKGKQTISICLYTAFPDFNPFLKKVVREWLRGKKKEKKKKKKRTRLAKEESKRWKMFLFEGRRRRGRVLSWK